MREDECKTCGGALVFEGSLLTGKAVCPRCERKPVHPMHGNSNLYNVGNPIGDPAYKGFSSMFPVGALLSCPIDGYTLPCDGRTLRRWDYQDLFRVVGARFGTGVDDTFRIPNLGGQYHIVTRDMSHTHTINFNLDYLCDPYQNSILRRK